MDKKSGVFWPSWTLAVFLALVFISVIFSKDPFYSFWESPFRGGGFLNYFLCVATAILAFLIIKKGDWPRIWFFATISGILVSFVAVFQKFGIFSKTIIPYAERPPGTMGGPTFLAVYLLLLAFAALSFLFKEKGWKKIFYVFAFILFFYVILLTGSRASYFGLLAGILYFLFFFPQKKLWAVKIIAVLILFLAVYSVYRVNYVSRDLFLPALNNNKEAQELLNRMSVRLFLEDPRFSAWKLSAEAIKENPVLGWGPENYSIAFDKYYDPALPFINRAWGSWYDKAHNFLIDIAVSSGIPALIAFLSFIAVLFLKLRKSEDPLMSHGVRTSIFAYFGANLFSFDTFSTYLIFFFVIAFGLKIISKDELGEEKKRADVSLWKTGLIFVSFFVLIAFLWHGCLKPLKINKEINYADFYLKQGNCDKALEKMGIIASSKSIIDSYLRLQYTDIIRGCIQQNAKTKAELAPLAVSILKEEKELRPFYTRTWITLASYLNALDKAEEAILAFEGALELSPKREESFSGLIDSLFLSKNYERATKEADKCLDNIPESALCWWKKSLSHIYLEELDNADFAEKEAIKRGFNPISPKPISETIIAYMDLALKTKDKKIKEASYLKLADCYQKLILYVDYNNYQYHASLAYAYKELGETKKAKEEALVVIKLAPELKSQVEEFIKNLTK